MSQTSSARLYKTLSELEVIPEDKLKQIWNSVQKRELQISFEAALKENGLISDENLGQVIADVNAWPFVRLGEFPIDPALTKLLNESFARAHKVVVFATTETGYKVAALHPDDLVLIDFVKKKLGKPIQVSYATETDIDHTINRFSAQIDKAQAESETPGQASGSAATTPDTVDAILELAVKQRASDVHIEPGEEENIVRLRIDGILHDITTFTKEQHQQMVTRIKVLAKLRTDEHQTAQDGKLQIKVEGEEIDVRVSVLPTTNGEKVVMRILTHDVREYTLSDLGFSESQQHILKQAIAKPYGMILATGPTGSGKTTTLYTLLKLLNSRDINITTIEDPVEYTVEGVNQIQVNEATNLTFAEGLRSIVRQDPNVILVGEIRDADTASISVNSAMTGHLVLSTLHTNTAATAIPRLIDMEVEPFLLASSVNVIIAQRLIRKVCPRCRVSSEKPLDEVVHEYAGNNHLLQHALDATFGNEKTVRWYKGKGCPVCHKTGYLGRIGIYELLEVSSKMREGITSNLDAAKLQEIAVAEGMKTMLEDGLEKVSQGLTTLEEVLRVTKE